MTFALIESKTYHDGTRIATCRALYETIDGAKRALCKLSREHQQSLGEVCEYISTATFAAIEYADNNDHHTTINLRIKQA